jgi:hypothetical protein
MRAPVVGPVVAQEFVGPPEAITSVVLTFNVPLDPTTAQNPDAYAMIRKFSSQDDGFFFSDHTVHHESKRIPITSATYDANANTVTLTPDQPFELHRSFTIIQVRGRGRNAVLQPGGAAIDGNGDTKPGGDVLLRFKSRAIKQFDFKEADGDRVHVELTGSGRLFYFLPIHGKSSPSIFIREADLANTVLSGTVRQGRNGDGVADIAQITGTSTATVPLLTDPAFRIRNNVP